MGFGWRPWMVPCIGQWAFGILDCGASICFRWTSWLFLSATWFKHWWVNFPYLFASAELFTLGDYMGLIFYGNIRWGDQGCIRMVSVVCREFWAQGKKTCVVSLIFWAEYVQEASNLLGYTFYLPIQLWDVIKRGCLVLSSKFSEHIHVKSLVEHSRKCWLIPPTSFLLDCILHYNPSTFHTHHEMLRTLISLKHMVKNMKHIAKEWGST